MILELPNKISPVKTGIDFLVSSHFQIGNDRNKSHDPFSYKSTFQIDYPLQKVEKLQFSSIPPPASIMHGDARFLEHCSINKEYFNPVALPEKTFSKNSLTKTNFKMDRDSRIDSFQTTNNLYHYPMYVDMKSKNLKQDPMKSYIPQGDKEKELWPKSDYKDKFHQKDLCYTDRVINDTLNGTQTIKGDIRSHGCLEMFDTTSRRELPPYSGYRKAEIPDHVHFPKTLIPSGKETSLESTHQTDFKGKLPLIPATFDRKETSELLKTNYKNGDNRFNCFQTTTEDCYTLVCNSDNSPISAIDANKSSFPQGDGISAAQRIHSTVNRSDFKSPPKDYHNPIVDGSNRHTVSKLNFGSENGDNETTMKSSFQLKNVKYHKVNNKTMHSSLSLHQDNNSSVGKSSYTACYQPTYGTKKLIPNPVAIENLKKSYICDPIRGLREFCTTHRESYTPKEISSPMYFEKGRLQKSSIPIGSLWQ